MLIGQEGMRLYWPEEAALDGSWKAPKLEIVK